MAAAPAARSTARSAIMAFAVTAVAASVANLAISLVAQALGADTSVFDGLTPAGFVPLTVIGTIAGLVGWLVVRRIATRPSAVMRRLVPTVVAVSLLPDIGVGVTMGWDGAVAFGLMHIALAAIAVAVFHRFLPLPR
jgi:Family of unknown function (DUF6069)